MPRFSLQSNLFYLGWWGVALPNASRLVRARTPPYGYQLGKVPDGLPGDWAALVWAAHRDSDLWHMEYRYRWYLDNRVFSSRDRKDWGEQSIQGQEEEILDRLRAILAWHEQGGGEHGVEWVVQGNLDYMQTLYGQNPPTWLHMAKIYSPNDSPEQEWILREILEQQRQTGGTPLA